MRGSVNELPIGTKGPSHVNIPIVLKIPTTFCKWRFISCDCLSGCHCKNKTGPEQDKYLKIRISHLYSRCPISHSHYHGYSCHMDLVRQWTYQRHMVYHLANCSDAHWYSCNQPYIYQYWYKLYPFGYQAHECSPCTRLLRHILHPPTNHNIYQHSFPSHTCHHTTILMEYHQAKIVLSAFGNIRPERLSCL